MIPVKPIAEFRYSAKAQSKIYWIEDGKFTLEVLQIGKKFALKGSKFYYIKSVSDRERFASRLQTLSSFLEYLRAHSIELQFYIHFLSNIAPSLIPIPEKALPKIDLEKLREEFIEAEEFKNLAEAEQLLFMEYLRSRDPRIRERAKRELLAWLSVKREEERRIKQLGKLLERAVKIEDLKSKIIHEWLRKGYGALYCFIVSSNIYVCEKEDLEQFVKMIASDLRASHSVIVQRARFGFHLIIEEIEEPLLAYDAINLGLLNPELMERLTVFPEYRELYEHLRKMYIIKPAEKIEVEGARVEPSLAIAQTVSDLLRRIAREERKKVEKIKEGIPYPSPIGKLPSAKDGRMAYLGLIEPTNELALLNLDDLIKHAFIVGATGSGKSIVAMLIAEHALIHGIPVIVVDTSNQWTGFLKPCGEKSMLKLYDNFYLKPEDARGFDGIILDMRKKREIPKNFVQKGKITVFACKELSDHELDHLTCELMYKLSEIYAEETDKLKVLLIIEEFHRHLPKYFPSSKSYLEIERVVRELRKYGLGVIVISQILTDFKASIRGNVSTEITMQTKYDGDLMRVLQKFGKDYRDIILHMPVPMGMMFNTKYNEGQPYFVHFRPPLHSPRGLTEEEMETLRPKEEIVKELVKIKGVEEMPKEKPYVFLGEEEMRFINAIKQHKEEIGRYPTTSELMARLEIRSWNKMYQIINRLEIMGRIRKELDPRDRKKKYLVLTKGD